MNIMKCSARYLTVLLALTWGTIVEAKQKSKSSHANSRNEAADFTRLQIFLDNANFGPGKIDGHDGDFTRKALALYRTWKGQPMATPLDTRARVDPTGLDLSSVDPVLIDYTITDDDAANVGALPKAPPAQAKAKRLPYATLSEAIAEKFHTDLSYLQKLNPKAIKQLKVGDKLKVPNVKAFELKDVKAIQPGSEAAAGIANELGEASPTSDPVTHLVTAGAADLSIHVSLKDNMLEVLSGEKIAAAFPVTVGSHQTVSPVGKWIVNRIAKMPNFRYDISMLNKGKRSGNFHVLPPGPNNPVGVMWIALNKKGIGIHGTNDPDSIGRAASHGCIRLANWDVVKVAELVKPGAKVTIE